jgi:hypothetical protein
MAGRLVWVAGLVPFLLSLMPITPSGAFVVKRDVSPADNSELQSGWTYVGCYSDIQNARTLSASNYADNKAMDASACIQYFSKKGYVYAGTEYSDGEWNQSRGSHMAERRGQFFERIVTLKTSTISD